MDVWLLSLFLVVFVLVSLFGLYKLWRKIRYILLKTASKTVEKVFKTADIEINGNRPWDIKVNNNKLIKRAIGQVLGFDRTGSNHILIIFISFGIFHYSVYVNEVL